MSQDLSLKFDLHCHSDYSDGKLSPVQLIDYAVERDLTHLALTDHDSIDGLDEALQYIQANNLQLSLIKGVEISALGEYGEVHIVGLKIDSSNKALCEGLRIQQEKRWMRAELISQRLQKLGVEGVFDYCQEKVKQVVTRTHIAQAIVDLGFSKDLSQAFKKYIGKKGRIKIEKDWIDVKSAVQLIQNAGGFAVLAHPTRYPLSNRKLSLLIKDFAESGGDALEMSYPSLNADKMAWLKIQRESNQLKASSGSDFHYPNLRWTDLGKFPQLDQTIPHLIQQII